jgi:hypothetical protein
MIVDAREIVNQKLDMVNLQLTPSFLIVLERAQLTNLLMSNMKRAKWVRR